MWRENKKAPTLWICKAAQFRAGLMGIWSQVLLQLYHLLTHVRCCLGHPGLRLCQCHAQCYQLHFSDLLLNLVSANVLNKNIFSICFNIKCRCTMSYASLICIYIYIYIYIYTVNKHWQTMDMNLNSQKYARKSYWAQVLFLHSYVSLKN